MAEFLLDVNVLVALGHAQHIHHTSAHEWLDSLHADDVCLTCSITEAAFIRLMMNPAITGDGRGLSAASAIAQLQAMRTWAGDRWQLISDNTTLTSPIIDQKLLERSLVGYSQVTDFHLLNLAASRRATLATFDQKLVANLPQALAAHTHLIRPDRTPEEQGIKQAP